MENSQKITVAIDWLVAHYEAQPNLEVVAAYVGMEPRQFQKKFAAYVGFCPKAFVQALTQRHARYFLPATSQQGAPVADVCVSVEVATPYEIRSKGAGMVVTYGFVPSPFGELIAARTERGLCYLGFRVDDNRERCLQRIFAAWPQAQFVENNAAIAGDCAGKNFKLHLFGTNFQIQVWQALLKIPLGQFASYEAIANAIGKPSAARAVGNAVGANPVSLIIPCHRVIRKSGVLDNYGWGSARKKALLGVECCAKQGV